MMTYLLFTVVGLVVFVWLFRAATSPKAKAARVPDSVWEEVTSQTTDPLAKLLIDVAKPLSGMQSVVDTRYSPVGRWVQNKLWAAGGLYGGSVEAYLAVQAAGMVIGLVFVLLGLAGVLPTVVALMLGLVATLVPYHQVDSKAKKRTTEITMSLPDFAELLQMPLMSGLTVLSALDFTARRSTGVVADEVRNMLTLIRTRALTDPEAFDLVARRLGTPEARSFFNALLQAHLEGAKVVQNLARQAESLRIAQFQARRAEAKKLPVKLIVIFGLHLMPMVFVIALIPAFMSLGSI
jgi:Flp pilus assembly protein TadB